jgi:hypothetical protein
MISAPMNLFVQLSYNFSSFLKVAIYLSKPRLASLPLNNRDDKMLGRNWLLSSYLVVMWLSSEHYKLINLLASLSFEEMMQGYMETDPSLNEMELDDEADLVDWEDDKFV